MRLSCQHNRNYFIRKKASLCHGGPPCCIGIVDDLQIVCFNIYEMLSDTHFCRSVLLLVNVPTFSSVIALAVWQSYDRTSANETSRFIRSKYVAWVNW